MPLDSPDDAVTAEKNAVATANAPIWLYEVDLDDRNTVYLAANPVNLTVDGNEYQAFPIATGEIEQTNEADVPRVSVTVSNITDEFGLLLDEQGGFVGRKIRKRWVWSHELDHPVDLFAAQILEADVNSEAVTFTVGYPSILEEKFPRGGYFPTCTFTYRHPDTCGWPLVDEVPAGVTDLPTCSHELEGPNGCRAHGQAYIDAGLTPLHPKRFGGFPTIPRRRQ